MNPEYRRQSRPEMQAFVPAVAKRIIDIGCGVGFFAAEIKERNGAEAWGVELDMAAAAEAATRLDRVMQGRVEDCIERLPDDYFDVIVCNDVLEHLVDPSVVLVALKAKLSSGGMLLASLPNIRYFPALKTILLDGDFPYQDQGIFDRTHLRFFTRLSMRRLFEEAGYVVDRQEGINAISKRSGQRSFRRWNRVLLGRLEDCRYLQYAVCASVKA